MSRSFVESILPSAIFYDFQLHIIAVKAELLTEENLNFVAIAFVVSRIIFGISSFFPTSKLLN